MTRSSELSEQYRKRYKEDRRKAQEHFHFIQCVPVCLSEKNPPVVDLRVKKNGVHRGGNVSDPVPIIWVSEKERRGGRAMKPLTRVKKVVLFLYCGFF